MLLVEQGVWNQDTTSATRAVEEWDPSVWDAIPAITESVAIDKYINQEMLPIMIDIGPSRDGSTFPEIQTLLTLAHPSTTIFTLDTNVLTVEAIQQQVEPKNPNIFAFEGNGWFFLPALEQNGIPYEALRGKVAIIMAANNLSIVVKQLEATGKKYEAYQFINSFLDQAKAVLHPRGEIILIGSKAVLHIGILIDHQTGQRLLYIPSYGYSEMHSGTDDEREKRQGVIFKTWDPWIEVLKSRDDVLLEERLPRLVDRQLSLITYKL